MRISILVPIYGVEKFIEKCARSLLNQTYKDIEFVFVDDCSPDKSVEVLQSVLLNYPEHKDNVKIVRHEVNSGLAATRQTGLDNATGDCIMFVDSDDYLDHDAVELLVEKMKENDCDIVSAGITHVFGNNKSFVDLPILTENKTECLELMLERKVIMNGVARLYKRYLFSLLEKPFVCGINFGEDYLLTSRIFYFATSISFVNRPIYNYYHANSDSYTSQFKRRNLDNLIQVDSIIYNFYNKRNETNLLEHHKVGRLKLKSEQLLLFLRSKSTKIDDYNYLLNSFNEDQNSKLIRCLDKQDQMVLKLSKHLPLIIMKIFARIGYRIKQLIK